MTKEEFNNLWKNCTREEILLQFYYDYTELQERISIIKEAIEKIESVQMLSLRSGKTLITTLLNDILEILDNENK